MSLSIAKLNSEKQDRDPEILALIGSLCSFSAPSDNGTSHCPLAFQVLLAQPVAFQARGNCPAGRLVFPPY